MPPIVLYDRLVLLKSLSRNGTPFFQRDFFYKREFGINAALVLLVVVLQQAHFLWFDLHRQPALSVAAAYLLEQTAFQHGDLTLVTHAAARHFHVSATFCVLFSLLSCGQRRA